jgi:hypothetical protein
MAVELRAANLFIYTWHHIYLFSIKIICASRAVWITTQAFYSFYPDEKQWTRWCASYILRSNRKVAGDETKVTWPLQARVSIFPGQEQPKLAIQISSRTVGSVFLAVQRTMNALPPELMVLAGIGPARIEKTKNALPASSSPSPRWPLPAAVGVSGSRRLVTGDHDHLNQDTQC